MKTHQHETLEELHSLLNKLTGQDPTILEIGGDKPMSLGEDGAKIIAEILISNAVLKTLKINNCHITDAGVIIITKALQDNTKLQELSIQNDQIGLSAAQALSLLLKKNSTLKNLSLANNQINGKACALIAEGLLNNKSITYLGMSNNPIGNEGARSMAMLLRANLHLKSVGLNNAKIGDEGGAEIAKALKGNRSLRSLNLNNNQDMDENTANCFAEVIASNRSLEYLGLLWNEFGISGFRKIARALEKNHTLQSYEGVCYQEATRWESAQESSDSRLIRKYIKRNNEIRLEITRVNLFMKALVEVGEGRQILPFSVLYRILNFLNQGMSQQNVIQLYTSIDRTLRNIDRLEQCCEQLMANLPDFTTLSLEGSQIGDSGAAKIAAAAMRNTKLTTLNLSNQQIGDVGAEKLAELLRTSTSLTTVNLSNNNFKHAGMEKILQALKDNVTLVSINLSNNSFSPINERTLLDVIRVNSTLTTLDLKDSGFPYNITAIFQTRTGYSNSIDGSPTDKEIIPAFTENTTLLMVNLPNATSKLNEINAILERNRKFRHSHDELIVSLHVVEQKLKSADLNLRDFAQVNRRFQQILKVAHGLANQNYVHAWELLHKANAMISLAAVTQDLLQKNSVLFKHYFQQFQRSLNTSTSLAAKIQLSGGSPTMSRSEQSSQLNPHLEEKQMKL